MADILIVDDEPSIVDVITYALETEGLATESCCTGAEALAELQKAPFDLILLDVGLPDCNGFELARQILSESSIPIIFLTARSNEIDRVVGLELGGDDYISKPFSPRELSARVKAVLRRTTVVPANVAAKPNINAPAFQVDEVRYLIRYHQQALDLSKTEYRLLASLVKAPGRVFSRDQLLDQAWEHSGYSLERTVDTHIKTLRRKLKAIAPDEDPIITHRGIGYSLESRE